MFGCAPATSIQDLGWERQSTIQTPQPAEPVEPTFQMVPPPQTSVFNDPQQTDPQFQASFGVPAEQIQQPSQQQLVALDPQKIRVAMLLPLSGPHAALGQAMANAAQLAVFDMGVDNFELLPRDTKGTAHGAMRAARDALASGSQLIIGPLFAASVSAVKPIVMASNINMLGLSTDMSLAGPRSYMMGFAPGPQIERIVAYAAQRGMKNYGAMVPPGPYGMLVRRAFKDAVERAGGAVIVEDLRGDVAPIVARKMQIDVLFVPYGGAALRHIVAKLEAAGLVQGDVQMMGTGLWDAPNIAGEEQLLIGGWYAAPEPELHDSFTEGYEASFGKMPPRLATLAYDATAMAVVLARNKLGYSQKSLELSTGFAGVDGLFRLQQTGRIERGLAINRITYTGSEVIDASPRTFEKEINMHPAL